MWEANVSKGQLLGRRPPDGVEPTLHSAPDPLSFLLRRWNNWGFLLSFLFPVFSGWDLLGLAFSPGFQTEIPALKD